MKKSPHLFGTHPRADRERLRDIILRFDSDLFDIAELESGVVSILDARLKSVCNLVRENRKNLKPEATIAGVSRPRIHSTGSDFAASSRNCDSNDGCMAVVAVDDARCGASVGNARKRFVWTAPRLREIASSRRLDIDPERHAKWAKRRAQQMFCVK